MKFDLVKACPGCPFRKSGDEPVRLRHGRVIEIHNAVAQWNGGEFPCHKTTEHGSDGEHIRRDDEQHCAGAIAYAHKVGEVPQVVRMGIHLLAGKEPTDYGPPEAVFDSFHDFAESALDYEDARGEPCNTVNTDCIAPAGYLSGGSVIQGDTYADCECKECGEPVCSECISDEDLCGSCQEWADQDREEQARKKREARRKKRKKSPRPLV